MDDARKTTIINKELARLNVDAACLQKTRLADSGSLMERDYTFFWQGLSQHEPKQYGVVFAVRNSLIATTETPFGGSSRILALPSGLCEHHIRLRPDSDLHPRIQGSILRGSAGNTIRNPKFRGHIFARRFQRSRWDRLALSRALLNPEHRHRHCPQCPA